MKIITIERCCNCPKYKFFESEGVCLENYKIVSEEEILSFPKWCTLEDKK